MNELLRYCRYYKGEDDAPSEINQSEDASLWSYEKLWVEREELHGENSCNIIEYARYGLENFNKEDGVPMTLKALLFNRHSHWAGGYGKDEEMTAFKEWYNSFYLKLTKDS
jgi:hypothetical protein